MVLFPASPPAVKEVTPALTAGDETSAGSGGILVIDDETVVRQMARATLVRHGYPVTLASSGREAIDLLNRDPRHFALVVLDLSMPGMTGAQTLPELRRARPDIPVLITSGYTEAQTMGVFAGQKVSGFLQKPFSSQVLVKRVSATLGRQQ